MDINVALDGTKKRDLLFYAGDDLSIVLKVYAHDGDTVPIAVTNVRFDAPAGNLPLGAPFTVPYNYIGRSPYRIVGDVAGIVTTLAYGVLETPGGWPSAYYWDYEYGSLPAYPFGVVGKADNITLLDAEQNFESLVSVEGALAELGSFKKSVGDISADVDAAVQAAAEAEAAADAAVTTLDGTVKKKTLSPNGAVDVGYVASLAGTIAVDLRVKAAETLGVREFGVIGDGVADDTAALQAAFDALGGQSVIRVLSGMNGMTLRLTGPVTLRSSDKTIDGTGATISLDSSTAGFRLAGNRGVIKGFRATQSSTAYTPTWIYIFNDATTTSSNYWRVVSCTSNSVYRSLHFYMGVTSSSCYRHTVYDCEFLNFFNSKLWSGSFGISFDGPASGNAAGNDSKVTNTICRGYERNFIVNNSVATSFINCSGDGAAYCFRYAGNSSGLRLVGGYYEYNDYIIEIADGDKYDAYVLYPSIAGTITDTIVGGAITFLSGGFSVNMGALTPTVKNGAFQTNQDGSSEIYAGGGIKFYSNNTKTLRGSLNSAGVWDFTGTAHNVTGPLSVNGSISTDTIRGYTGGGTALRITTGGSSGASKVVIGVTNVDFVECVQAGHWQPTVDSVSQLGASNKRWTTIFGNGLALTTAGVPIYADNAAAIAGGLAAGAVYRTATGQMMMRY